jgi:hypothetical protein
MDMSINKRRLVNQLQLFEKPCFVVMKGLSLKISISNELEYNERNAKIVKKKFQKDL